MSKAEPIPDRKRMTDLIADDMHDNYRAWSIDTLLTWPDHAKAMARRVLRKLGRRPDEHRVHEVLRCALSSRKRGDLKRDRH